MRIKNHTFTQLAVPLEKREHEALNTGVKLAHEDKCQRDLAAFHEEVAKGKRRPKVRKKNLPPISGYQAEYLWRI